MKIVLLLLSLISACLSIKEVISVIMLTNGGARKPKHKKKYIEYSKHDPEDLLTETGKRQMYILGGDLRIKYKKLVEGAKKHQVEIRSASIEGSLQSGYALASGLFPAGTGADFPIGYPNVMKTPPFATSAFKYENTSTLPRQSQSFYVTPEKKTDSFFFHSYPYMSCPSYFVTVFNNMHKDVNKTIIQNFMKKYPQEQNFEFTGDNFEAYFDKYQHHIYTKGQHPTGLTEHDYQLLRVQFASYVLNYKLLSHYPVNNIQKVGHLYPIHTTNIAKYIASSWDLLVHYPHFEPKFTIFSGTDLEVFSFLIGMGLGTSSCYTDAINNEETASCESYPKPGSSLIFELHHDSTDGKRYVRSLYNGVGVSFCDNKHSLPDGYCTYSGFIKHVRAKLVHERLIQNRCMKNTHLKTIIEYEKEHIQKYRFWAVIGIVAACLFMVWSLLECVFRGRDRALLKKTMDEYEQLDIHTEPESQGDLGRGFE